MVGPGKKGFAPLPSSPSENLRPHLSKTSSKGWDTAWMKLCWGWASKWREESMTDLRKSISGGLRLGLRSLRMKTAGTSHLWLLGGCLWGPEMRLAESQPPMMPRARRKKISSQHMAGPRTSSIHTGTTTSQPRLTWTWWGSTFKKMSKRDGSLPFLWRRQSASTGTSYKLPAWEQSPKISNGLT